jgi:hypothetical protein
MIETYVVKTADGRYVAPTGFVSKVDDAVRFTSRMSALEGCKLLGSVMHFSQILRYSEEQRAQETPQRAGEAEGSPDV